MRTRRQFLNFVAQTGMGVVGLASLSPRGFAQETGIAVNDIHSKLNSTRIAGIIKPDSEDQLRSALLAVRDAGKTVSIAGGRHAMGGQQFAKDAVLIDTRGMRRILSLDDQSGVVEVEAGVEWPELIDGLVHLQAGRSAPLGIVQKQTGADRLTLGGALGANIHGRGLSLRPIIGDVEAFSLMNAEGQLLNCSRNENSELFRLVIGGYGLFGVVTRVKLRLMPRTKLERVVKIIDVDSLMVGFEQRISEGYIYGDCQFSTDMDSDNFLRTGVFSCYRPLLPDAYMPVAHHELREGDWHKLYYLSHTDTRKAYEAYTAYYLSTTGQRYWSDTHQLSVYLDDYHSALDRQMGAKVAGSEMISELYVPRTALGGFLSDVREDFRKFHTQLIYGTIRLIAKDDESFLAWAQEPWACIVMNLHINHTMEHISKSADDFRRLIDRAIAHGGSYYLTYHRWARPDQIEQCYPQMGQFLKLKKQYDPEEIFVSDWYRHYRNMYADRL
jgi:FAD/FMN-containing dehydrogenase